MNWPNPLADNPSECPQLRLRGRCLHNDVLTMPIHEKNCFTDDYNGTHMNDSDETFLKSVLLREPNTPRGDNFTTLTPITNQSYLSTPPLDADGNVQSAQTRRVTSGADIRPPVFSSRRCCC